MEEQVILIVKAANQTSPDQRVECEGSWTVGNLKTHISNTHPVHPKTEEQRLIYSGQLLLDHHQLYTILRRPSEDNTYTIHLVCSPPPQPPPRTSRPLHQASPPPTRTAATSESQEGGAAAMNGGQQDTTDGIRRRHPTTSNPQTLDAPGPPPPAPSPPLAPHAILQPSADPMHQVAAMQQIYAHYMAYVQYMQMGGGVGGLPWPQQMIQIPPPPNPATATTAAATAPPEPPEQPQPDPTQPVDPPPQAPPQQPIRMNAQGGEVEDDEEEEGAARDWLDWIYVLSRMIVLLSIVYFYSTLSRFMIVIFITMLLYLYQAGWFRPTRRVDGLAAQPNPANNNNNNNNNNNEAAHMEEEEEEEEDEEEEEEEEEEVEIGRREGVMGSDGMAVVIRPSLLSLSWTFITSFFTSLIPEQPQGV